MFERPKIGAKDRPGRRGSVGLGRWAHLASSLRPVDGQSRAFDEIAGSERSSAGNYEISYAKVNTREGLQGRRGETRGRGNARRCRSVKGTLKCKNVQRVNNFDISTTTERHGESSRSVLIARGGRGFVTRISTFSPCSRIAPRVCGRKFNGRQSESGYQYVNEINKRET